MRRQIEGEIAWQRLQHAKIERSASATTRSRRCSTAERVEGHRGISCRRDLPVRDAGDTQAQTLANANKILEQLRNGASFAGYARQYSEASTAAVGGDLGWVRPEQLPAPLAARSGRCRPGAVSDPIPVPGGVSIIAVQDTRKILTRRSARRGPQPEADFDQLPQGHDASSRRADVARFAEATQNIGGCGGADKIAADFHGEVVQQRSGQDARPAAGASADDAPDAGRPGDAAVRIAR